MVNREVIVHTSLRNLYLGYGLFERFMQIHDLLGVAPDRSQKEFMAQPGVVIGDFNQNVSEVVTLRTHAPK